MSDRRKLYLDICNYKKEPIYSLYDNDIRTTGQAYNIIVQTERNGWRELSFSIPSVCQTKNGEEPNEAIKYLKSDFFIRLIDDFETDWFVISEPKITHSGFAKTISVTAGHISQQLRVRNLGLEFSDDEGNNVGTAAELLDTVLQGTGWKRGYVADFTEKRDKNLIKRRSLKAPAKTGAFKLISMICDLFEAKPVYHGDTKIVDIVPINPFSTYESGTLPDLSRTSGVIELHYGKNVRNVTRIMNSENIVTKLYAYGSFGDKTNGYCGIDQCVHTEYEFTINTSLVNDKWYYFTVQDDAGIDMTYRFSSNDVDSGDVLIFSMLDPSSMMYVWNANKNKALMVYKDKQTGDIPLSDYSTVVKKDNVKNWFSFVMNFNYYREVGIMSDEDVQVLAAYQRTAPEYFERVNNAATNMSEKQTDLSKIIGSVDFCKLDVKSVEDDDGYMKLVLDKDTYEDGIIYRSDYDSNKLKRFTWKISDALNNDGDPTNRAASIVYIVRNVDPVSKEKLNVPIWWTGYLKKINGEGDAVKVSAEQNNPNDITLWLESDVEVYPETDNIFLFGYNAINGYLGSLQSADEAAVVNIRKQLTVGAQEHKVIFTNELPTSVSTDSIIDYGWLWNYDNSVNDRGNLACKPSTLYFCYKTEGDNGWKKVYVENDPNKITDPVKGEYFFNWKKSTLYKRGNDTWEPMQKGAQAVDDTNLDSLARSSTDTTIASMFGTVYAEGLKRDMYYQGVSEQLIYTVSDGSTLPIGRYYFTNKYGTMYTFVTTQELKAGDTLTYYYTSENVLMSGYVIQKVNGVEETLNVKQYRFDNVFYHPDNILDGMVMEQGEINDKTGEVNTNETSRCMLSGFATVYPDTEYRVNNLMVLDFLTGNVKIYLYAENKKLIQTIVLNEGDYLFTTPNNAKYLKYTYPSSLEQYNNNIQDALITANTKDIIIDNQNYKYLETVNNGNTLGIIELMKKLAVDADALYINSYDSVKAAQDSLRKLEDIMTEKLGDIYKEGFWQDASYIAGDEVKLYDDAIDNLDKISHPETTYNIDFLDPYESNMNDKDYCVAPETLNVQWEDFDISTAVHLVDPEIDINTWGFIDKIQKCYDKPYQTKLAINTNLTTIAQHSFSDVMSNIADVASTVRGKISKYDTVSSGRVTYGDYYNVLSNLVTLTKVTEKAGGRINEMENDITGHSSRITQTANLISTEVARATEQEEQLRSLINQTADSISLSVSQEVKQQFGDVFNYQLIIDSNHGNFISDSIGQITLTAHALKGASNEDDKIQNIIWTRDTGSEDEDTIWNEAHKNYHGSLTVDRDSVGTQATFIATATIDNQEYKATFSVADISQVNLLEVYIASNLQSVQVKTIDVTPTYIPNWENKLILTPSVYYNGSSVIDKDDLRLVWKRRNSDGSTVDISSDLGESVVGNNLVVSKNILDNDRTYVSYICYAEYSGITSNAEKEFSLITTKIEPETCKINGLQVFKYDNSGNPLYDFIDLVVSLNGCTIDKWQYRNAENKWVDYPGAENNNTSLTVKENDPVFVNDALVVRVTTIASISGEAGPSDTFTIYKVYDGSQNATIFLTNESIAFRADADGNVVPGVYETNIVAYQGKNKVLPTYDGQILNRHQIPEGLIIERLDVTNDEIPLKIYVPDDGNSYNFGTPDDTDGFIELVVTSPSVTTLRLTWTKRKTSDESISSITTYYAKWYDNVLPPDRQLHSTFREGETPILDLAILNASGWWSTTAPTVDAFEKYLWAYDVIRYTDGTENTTDPRVVGALGSSGMTVGINTPNGEVFDQNTIELIAEAYIYSGADDISTAAQFKWDYYYNGQWNELFNEATGKKETDRTHRFTINWLRANCSGGTTVRCIIQYGSQNYVSYCNIIDKTDNYQAVIYSAAGDTFYNGVGYTTLICRIYQNGKEIDADGSMFEYTWTRIDEDGNNIDGEDAVYSTDKSIYVKAAGYSAIPQQEESEQNPSSDDSTENPDEEDDAGDNTNQNETTLEHDEIDRPTTFICFVKEQFGNYSTQAQYSIDYTSSIIYSDTRPEIAIPNMLWMDTSINSNGGNTLYRWDSEAKDFVEVFMPKKAVDQMLKEITKNTADITVLSDSINQKVEQITETINGVNSRITETLFTNLQQTSDAFELSVNEKTNAVASAIEEESRQRSTWMRFDKNFLELGRSVDNEYKITRSKEEPSNPEINDLWLDITSGTDPVLKRFDGSSWEIVSEDEQEAILKNKKFKARLTNTKLSFMEDDDEIAYYSNRAMFITEARITDTFNIGSNRKDMPGWFQYHMEKDGLAMSWKAEEFTSKKLKIDINYVDANGNSVDNYSDYFLFVIKETDNQWNPLTSARKAYSEILSNSAKDHIYFKTLVFDEATTKYFTISQIKGGMYGDVDSSGNYLDPAKRIVTYDETVYKIAIQVNKVQGYDQYAIESIKVTKNNDTNLIDVDNMTFTNRTQG